jgi:hypothetical protein
VENINQILNNFILYLPIIIMAILVLYALYLILYAFAQKKYYISYVPAIALFLVFSLFTLSGIWHSRVVFSEYQKIVDTQEQLKKLSQELIDKVQKQFSYDARTKYILYKKGTLSELYTIKTEEAVNTTGHKAEVIRFQSTPQQVIADLSERGITVKFVPFILSGDLIQALGVLQEYFLINAIDLHQVQDKEGYIKWSLSVQMKQWEWGNSTGLQNPYVIFYTFDNQGHKLKVAEGYFWDIYPTLDRSRAYFITKR